MAPERLLVFELTGDVGNFTRAATRIEGLEIVGAEDIEPDEFDPNPTAYLLIQDAAAMQQMVGLWRTFQAGRQLPVGLAPWRDLFSQLRDVRPWGPEDRLSPEDAALIAEEAVDERGMVRVELELVFRPPQAAVGAKARRAVQSAQGTVVSESRVDGAKYHAMLADIPQAEIARVLARDNGGLIASEAIMHVRPQSVVHLDLFENSDLRLPDLTDAPERGPIAAVFDAVPISEHPRLAGRLIVDDPFDLESLAVGRRVHGTAMASAVVHGDLAAPALPELDRRVLFVNVMYAPGDVDSDEIFPSRLPADLFHEAVVRMREQGIGPEVVIVNASLGDRNKPFAGRVSGWARVVDYLSHRYGILFVVSAGNHQTDIVDASMSVVAFEDLDSDGRARAALRALGNVIANRRVLAPAEAMNAITVGSLSADSVVTAHTPASVFDLWSEAGLCNVSSGLGPGIGNAVKPDILAPGGRHHVRLMGSGTGHLLRPLGKNAGALGGIVVAAPPAPADPGLDRTAQSVGTSVSAALMTGVAARAHEVLEDAYPDFLAIPAAQRAALLKALLVHTAKWTGARDMIVDVLGPSDGRQHVRQRDNIRRFLGFGAVEAEAALGCAGDRATLWAVGQLLPNQSHTFSFPLPVAISGKAQPHEVRSTLAWFAPPRVGVASYKGVRLAIVEPHAAAATLAVSGAKSQPDKNQAHRGTVIHRRWDGAKAAAIAADAAVELTIQRQPDDSDEFVPYGFVCTLEMPGVVEVYTQVLARVGVKPRVAVRP